MASPRKRLTTNAEGPFYVDSSCIDCDTCRKIAPKLFDRAEEKSRVFAQPGDLRSFTLATEALIACPTASIGTTDKSLLTDIPSAYPKKIQANVYFCGYTSEKSFGAWSYLIVRPEGNVLVDSPRFAGPLVTRLAALGGVDTLFLTHRDDVADHQKYHDRFGCQRILHVDEIKHDTRLVEMKLVGTEAVRLDSDLMMIPVPGHTEGHVALLYKNKFLFTGDHLAYSHKMKHLYASKEHCWHSYPMQRASVSKLLNYDFEWILPGHGRALHAPADLMKVEIQRCLDWMKQ